MNLFNIHLSTEKILNLTNSQTKEPVFESTKHFRTLRGSVRAESNTTEVTSDQRFRREKTTCLRSAPVTSPSVHKPDAHIQLETTSFIPSFRPKYPPGVAPLADNGISHGH